MGDSAGCESFAERKDLKWMICSVLRMLLKSMRMIRGTHFFQALFEIVHSAPKRTRVWLMGDFACWCRCSQFSCWTALQSCHQQPWSRFGARLLISWAFFLLANIFRGWGPTWRSPDGESSHCIDYTAICLPILFRAGDPLGGRLMGKVRTALITLPFLRNSAAG